MAHVLLTGVATLDIVTTVDGYPPENSEVRAAGRRICAGGNAANSARVLAALGHRADLCAVLADDPDGGRIERILDGAGVGTGYSLHTVGATPISSIVINRRNGSRTIVHYRDLPELPATHFAQLPLERFDWLHFEGRNVEECERMMGCARRRLTDQPVSLEIEKERPGIERLAALADLVIFAHAFAAGRGHGEAATFLHEARSWAPQALLCCTWGEGGAWALDRDGALHHSPAFRPPEVRDTLGAGDVFNAGMIDSLAGGRTLPEALAAACRLAGEKVGVEGLLV